MLRYDFLNVTEPDSLNTSKMHYEQFYVQVQRVKYIGYMNYCFINFSDLELSFWFELRYSKM